MGKPQKNKKQKNGAIHRANRTVRPGHSRLGWSPFAQIFMQDFFLSFFLGRGMNKGNDSLSIFLFLFSPPSTWSKSIEIPVSLTRSPTPRDQYKYPDK